ncbi:hypothetical protein J5U18_05665 [Sphingobacteriaceae bacterium WQ 2009]|uniref:Uncharacterized protein n=1 Tax=Rhinopithecimicrobium faecis TaxID=2820698 RepID=A0A8T4H7H7_9SPHI|nr:hypothetical protein [Sphingobacteriaceae bacterium WQ 2009]
MRLTPINIAVACVLTWYITESRSDKPLFSIGLLLLWIAIFSVVDVLFRLRIKETQKLWFMQLGFILVVSIGSVLIKLYS